MEWPAHPPLEGGGGVSSFRNFLIFKNKKIKILFFFKKEYFNFCFYFKTSI